MTLSFRKIITSSTFLATAACVTTQGVNPGEISDRTVAIECQRDTDFRDDAYQAVVCEVRNHGTNAKTIEVTGVGFSRPGAEVKLLADRELEAAQDNYAKSRAQRLEHNLAVPFAMGLAAGNSAQPPGIAGAIIAGAAVGGIALAKPPETAEIPQNLLGTHALPANNKILLYGLFKSPPNQPLPCDMQLTLAQPAAERVDVSLKPSVRSRVVSACEPS